MVSEYHIYFKDGDDWGIRGLLISAIAIEDGPFIVDLPMKDDDVP